jgi:hypothetical protein
MRERPVGTSAVKAETLRSEQLPQPMAVVVVVVALAQHLQALAGVAAVSVQRGRQQATGEPTVVVVAVMVSHRQA